LPGWLLDLVKLNQLREFHEHFKHEFQ